MTMMNFHGPLRHNPANPCYFTDDTGRAIYLTGSFLYLGQPAGDQAGGRPYAILYLYHNS